jgi:hypothetical protein
VGCFVGFFRGRTGIRREGMKQILWKALAIHNRGRVMSHVFQQLDFTVDRPNVRIGIHQFFLRTVVIHLNLLTLTLALFHVTLI